MTQARLLSVALKLTGVVCLFQAAQLLASGVAMGSSLAAAGSWGSVGIGLVVTIAFVVALLLITGVAFQYGDAIARRLFPDDKTLWEKSGPPGPEWYTFAFTVTGVVLLVEAVLRAFRSLMPYLIALTDETIRSIVMYRNVAVTLATLALQVAVCLYLVFGSHHLTQLVLSLKGDTASSTQ